MDWHEAEFQALRRAHRVRQLKLRIQAAMIPRIEPERHEPNEKISSIVLRLTPRRTQESVLWALRLLGRLPESEEP